MKIGFMLAAVMVFVAGCLSVREAPRLATFAVHIKDYARVKGLELPEAARRFWNAGFRGIDVGHGWESPEEVREFAALGFSVVNVCVFPEFEKGYREAWEREAIAFASACGAKRIMVVAGLYPEGCDRAEMLETFGASLRRFTAAAAAQGFSVSVEDFDNLASPTYDSSCLGEIFARAPELKLTFDTGGFPFAGEDPLEAQRRFADRIVHYHIKDHSKGVPIEEIVRRAAAAGYDGWFTIENFTAKDKFVSVRALAARVRAGSSSVGRSGRREGRENLSIRRFVDCGGESW